MRKSFVGRTQEEARARFQADLAEASAAGCVPSSEQRGVVGDEHILVVEYRPM
jgi:hypothetical protein